LVEVIAKINLAAIFSVNLQIKKILFCDGVSRDDEMQKILM